MVFGRIYIIAVRVFFHNRETLCSISNLSRRSRMVKTGGNLPIAGRNVWRRSNQSLEIRIYFDRLQSSFTPRSILGALPTVN